MTDAASAVLERIKAGRAEFSRSELRVGEVVLADPESVAFGTVASVAELAETSGPTVIRFANRLGFEGYKELQQAVREDLGRMLRPAASRIRSTPSGDVIARTLQVEIENVTASLEAIDPTRFDEAAALLVDPTRTVHVIPSEQTRPIGAAFAAELGILRENVRLVFGSEFRVASLLAGLRRGDVVMAIDLHRYERWVVHAQHVALDLGARPVTITDSELSPLAGDGPTFVVRAEASGPFDSLIGIHAIANALVAEAAQRLRRRASRRLDRLEQVWAAARAFEP
jgi:DNA-binding MurR/RpiR family transcriptional regulator